MSAVGRKPKSPRPVRAELLRLADSDPERWALACLQIAQYEGWSAYPDKRWCVNLVRQRINGRLTKAAARSFDVDWLLIVLDHFPEAPIADLFVRRAAKAEARREMEREVA